MSTTTTSETSLRLTACDMPLVFLKRIPSKIEKALRALNEGDAVEFTRQMSLAARLHDTCSSVLGNVAQLSRPNSDNTSYAVKEMIGSQLADFKHLIFAMRTTLGVDESKEHFKVEESDSTVVRPHGLSDKQAVETVKTSMSTLVTLMRQAIKSTK